MAVKFEFHDYSPIVKAKIKGVCNAMLFGGAEEVKSKAISGINESGWDDNKLRSLRDSYSYVVDKENGVAQVGSTIEEAFWEEFGTGSHADTAKNGGKQGRQDWWVYTPGRDKPEGEAESTHYKTKEDAESAAAYIKSEYNKDAVATNGRDPNYTLEKAFTKTYPKWKRELERRLKSLDGTKGASE